MSDRQNLPDIPDDLPDGLFDFLEALKLNYEIDQGSFGVSEKRPTVQDLIDAGVTNADKIK